MSKRYSPNIFYYCQFFKSLKCLLHLVKQFLICPVYFVLQSGHLRWKFHCLNIQTVELTDIKKVSRNLVRETQQIGFYDSQFFLLATTNISRETQHVYLVPYISLCLLFVNVFPHHSTIITL